MIDRVPSALPAHGADGNALLPARLPDDSARLLAFLEGAFAALETASDPADVLDIRDLGETARHWARQRRLGMEAQIRGMELRLRADRWFGQYLIRTERNNGGRPHENPSIPSIGFPTLRELGLTPDEAVRCRRLVHVPEGEFTAWLEEHKREAAKITISAVLALADRFMAAGFEHGRATAAAEAEAIANQTNQLLRLYQGATGKDNADIRDLFQTPGYALDCILEFIPHHWRIWECASGPDETLVAALRQRGNPVISTDIVAWQPGRAVANFLEAEPDPDSFDLILTNPPFIYKDPFLARCFHWWERFRKPFWLLMPSAAIAEQARMAMFGEHGVDVAMPPKRINFITPTGKTEETGSSAWFFTCWYGRGAAIPPERFRGRVLYPAPAMLVPEALQ